MGFGELPDIDLQTDSVFLILDQDGYYQSQSAASDIGGSAGESGEGGTASAKTPPKKTCRICKRSFKRRTGYLYGEFLYDVLRYQ